jgi:uncharacterized protein (TIGR03067 family)
MRWLAFLLLLALLPSRLLAEEPPVSLKALQGTWKCIWFEYRGVKADKLDTGARLVIKDNGWTWATAPKAKITLDSTTFPAVIDLAFDDAVAEGICRLDGDKLTVCLVVDPGDKIKKRPMKFETEEGDGFEVIYFERDAEK